jgi:hypothetical protein
VWLQEREVQRVVAADNVPFSEAIKRVPDPPPSGRSFAEIAARLSKPRRVAPPKSDFGSQTVDQRSVGIQVGSSGLEVSSVETETDAPCLVVSRVQTNHSCYEFYSASAGEWVTRVSEYDFDEAFLCGSETPFDAEDPFMPPTSHGTVVGDDVFVIGPSLASDIDDTGDEEDEEMEAAKPLPQTFVADDGQVFATEKQMLKRNEQLVGCKLLPLRSRSINRPAECRYIVGRNRSINRPAPSHTGRSSRRQESRSPIKPP